MSRGGRCPESAALIVRFEETCRVARVTHTEAYFIEILSSVPKEKLKPEIRHRIASMAQPEKQVNSDDVFPVLWQRVMAENRSRWHSLLGLLARAPPLCVPTLVRPQFSGAPGTLIKCKAGRHEAVAPGDLNKS